MKKILGYNYFHTHENMTINPNHKHVIIDEEEYREILDFLVESREFYEKFKERVLIP